MFSYEYGQASYDLEEIKEKLLAYLKNCSYPDTQNAEVEAKATFKYLESTVDKIIKRNSVNIRFGSGGSPLWHSTVLHYLSKWVAAEIKMGKIIANELDPASDD
jgi:methionine synthase I (cobalamin-dependent)